MFGKLSKKSSLKHICVVSLSNVGDVVLTAPVSDVLLRDFPQADIDVIVGPTGKTLFENHPRIATIVFDKHMSGFDYARWCWNLRLKQFDCIVDLRQSGFGIFLPCRFRTSLWPKPFVGHMREKHLERLRHIYPDFILPVASRLAIIPKDVDAIKNLDRYIVMAPGAADERKRWPEARFAQLAGKLISLGEQIVFVGDQSDKAIIDRIMTAVGDGCLSLAGQTDLRSLAFVLSKAKYAIVNDSGIMHMASYMNLPVIALWGPTDVQKYGPWSPQSRVVKKTNELLSIDVEDVLSAISENK